MLAIGRGLMIGGKPLLLDEPSLGLAPIVIDQIYEVITNLKAEGRTILLVEENASRVADVADVAYLLDDGRIVWQGLAQQMWDNAEMIETYLGRLTNDDRHSIIVSGLTLGSMYAVSSVSLSLLWGTLGVLNMAQGAFLAIGGYAAFTATSTFGLPAPLAILVTVLVGAPDRLHHLFRPGPLSDEPPGFETAVIIATFGLSLIVQNLVLRSSAPIHSRSRWR